jgi:hypothetical protein
LLSESAWSRSSEPVAAAIANAMPMMMATDTKAMIGNRISSLSFISVWKLSLARFHVRPIVANIAHPRVVLGTDPSRKGKNSW